MPPAPAVRLAESSVPSGPPSKKFTMPPRSSPWQPWHRDSARCFPYSRLASSVGRVIFDAGKSYSLFKRALPIKYRTAPAITTITNNEPTISPRYLNAFFIGFLSSLPFYQRYGLKSFSVTRADAGCGCMSYRRSVRAHVRWQGRSAGIPDRSGWPPPGNWFALRSAQNRDNPGYPSAGFPSALREGEWCGRVSAVPS